MSKINFDSHIFQTTFGTILFYFVCRLKLQFKTISYICFFVIKLNVQYCMDLCYFQKSSRTIETRPRKFFRELLCRILYSYAVCVLTDFVIDKIPNVQVCVCGQTLRRLLICY